MPGRWHVFIVLSSVCWQLVLISEYFTGGKNVYRYETAGMPQYDFIVGILSARRNREQRQALRETWVGHISKNQLLHDRVLIKFIVGDKPCPIPPLDRLDRYSCDSDAIRNPVLDEDVIAYKVPRGAVGQHTHRGPLGMDFRVNFPVVVTQLGAFDSNSDGFHHGLKVRLYDKTSQVEVVSANFTPEDPGDLIGGSRFKSVTQFLLPKGFEGSIVAENFSLLDPSSNDPMVHSGLDTAGGLISFQKTSRFGLVQGIFPDSEEKVNEEKNQYAAGTFIYHAHVPGSAFTKETLDTLEKEAEERKKMWQTILLNEKDELQHEMSIYDDIHLVNITDVYRHLPKKLLQFYTWAANNVQFNFMFKTDDDCFVDVEAIFKELAVKKLRGKRRIWWSRFRNDWPVERVGKWRELDYTASVYPSFACGAGNVLSADLVRWLAQNADHLKPYQGEDVSMGIWLSAVGPTLVKDYRWSCGPECDAGTFTSPENDPEDLREMWAYFTNCHDPCGCS